MAQRVHGWRKLAGSTWGRPMDPQFYGDLELDAGQLLAYIDEVRQVTGVHLTMTHLVGRAVAHGLAKVPELRVRLARGREYRREGVDVFFIVTTEGGRELTGVKVHGADRKSCCRDRQGTQPPLRCDRSRNRPGTRPGKGAARPPAAGDAARGAASRRLAHLRPQP